MRILAEASQIADAIPYHSRACLHRRGIKVRIARRGVEGKSRLGRVRWVVERTLPWLLRFKRLGLRYDRTQCTTLALHAGLHRDQRPPAHKDR